MSNPFWRKKTTKSSSKGKGDEKADTSNAVDVHSGLITPPVPDMNADIDDDKDRIPDLVGLKGKYVDEDVKDLLKFLNDCKYRTFKHVADVTDEIVDKLKVLIPLKVDPGTFDNFLKLREALQNSTLGARGRKSRRSSVFDQIPLTEYEEKLDPTKSPLNKLNFDFEYIGSKDDKIVEILTGTFEEYVNKGTHQSSFEYPVVTGASGSGKTRAAWEAASHMPDAIHLFVNCEDTSHYGDERGTDAKDALALQILNRCVPAQFEGKIHPGSLASVLERLHNDTGKSIVILQLDEYARNPKLARAIIRACTTLFTTPSSKMLVVPVLTGVAYGGIHSDLIATSNAVPKFLTLTNVDPIAMFAEFKRDLGITNDEDINLGMVTQTFGGVPRVFYFMKRELERNGELLKSLRNGKPLGADDAKEIYNKVLARYDTRYGTAHWEKALGYTETVFDGTERRESERSIDNEDFDVIIKKIHTFAVTGQTIRVRDKLLVKPDAPKGYLKTYEELAASGIFTLVYPKPNQYSEATIFIPVIALDSMASVTGICRDGELLNINYWWEHMELVALYSLRCRYNAKWYEKGMKKTSMTLGELRPGALMNDTTSKLSVTVDGELDTLLLLAEEITPDVTKEYKTGKLGNGELTKLKTKGVYALVHDAAGNDGLVIFKEFCLWNQAKAREANTKKGKSSQKKMHMGDVKALHAAQIDAGSKCFTTPKGAEQPVYDLFTNWLVSSRGQLAKIDATDKIPERLMVTNFENFRQVVGPIFGQLCDLFPTT